MKRPAIISLLAIALLSLPACDKKEEKKDDKKADKADDKKADDKKADDKAGDKADDKADAEPEGGEPADGGDAGEGEPE